jgi:hypothetical protein
MVAQQGCFSQFHFIVPAISHGCYCKRGGFSQYSVQIELLLLLLLLLQFQVTLPI